MWSILKSKNGSIVALLHLTHIDDEKLILFQVFEIIYSVLNLRICEK